MDFRRTILPALACILSFATPTTTEAGFIGQFPPLFLRPDLVPSYHVTPLSGGWYRIDVTTTNVGLRSSGSSHSWIWCYNRQTDQHIVDNNYYIPALGVGDSWTYTFLLPPSNAGYSISILSDAQNEVVETNENNNYAGTYS